MSPHESIRQAWQGDKPQTLYLNRLDVEEKLRELARGRRRRKLFAYLLIALFALLLGLRMSAGPRVITAEIEWTRFLLALGIVVGYERLYLSMKDYQMLQRPLSILNANGTPCLDSYRDELRTRVDYFSSSGRLFVPLYFAGLPFLASTARAIGSETVSPFIVAVAYGVLAGAALFTAVRRRRKELPFVFEELARLEEIRKL